MQVPDDVRMLPHRINNINYGCSCVARQQIVKSKSTAKVGLHVEYNIDVIKLQLVFKILF